MTRIKLAHHKLPTFKVWLDKRRAMIYPLTFGRARLAIGPLRSLVFDDEW